MRVEKKPPQLSIAVFRKSYPHEKLDEVLFSKNIAITRIPLVRFAKVREYEPTLREYLKLQLALLQEQGKKKPPTKTPTIIWLFTSQQAVYRSMEVMNKWIHVNLKEGYSSSKHKKFLQELFHNSKLRNRVKIAAVGRSTEKLINTFGLRVDYSVDENPGERTGLVGQQAVFELLKKATGQKNPTVQVVHPGAKKIDNYLKKNLQKTMGMYYRAIPLYETIPVSLSRAAGKKLWKTNYWFITSPSIAKNLFTEFGKIMQVTESEKLPQLIVIGKTTQRALKSELKQVSKKHLAMSQELIRNAKMLAGNFSEDTARRIMKTIAL